MKVAIIGSRNCGELTVEKIIENLPKKVSTVISGGAAGVDTLAREVAARLKVPIVEIVPNYEIFGKQAPLIRNKEIVETADEVVAFWDYKSRGTRAAILNCLKLNKPVKIVIIDKYKHIPQ